MRSRSCRRDWALRRIGEPLNELLRNENASRNRGVTKLTYVAGVKDVNSTRAGIQMAVVAATQKKRAR
jgi:hypothetical protein